MPMTAMIDIADADKTFTMHLQGGVELPVVARRVASRSRPANASCSAGPSGAGKMLDPEDDLRQLPLRRRPHRRPPSAARWSTSPPPSRAQSSSVRRAHHRLCQPVPARGAARCRARRRRRAAGRERRCRAPRRASAPASCCAASTSPSGCGRCRRRPSPAASSSASTSRAASSPTMPILLLDEPTASLDAANRAVVVELIAEKKRQGVAMVGIFHDDDVRDADRRPHRRRHRVCRRGMKEET